MFVIPSKRSASRDLRSIETAVQTFGAKILRLRLRFAQDDSIVRINSIVQNRECGMRADDIRPYAGGEDFGNIEKGQGFPCPVGLF